ncbi:MAG: hypothetical protein LBM66_06395, partial [Bifidobacteriaceae bacterium]|nr:hypothetical protein [Bifidobacteriaceae bacterium]
GEDDQKLRDSIWTFAMEYNHASLSNCELLIAAAKPEGQLEQMVSETLVQQNVNMIIDRIKKGTVQQFLKEWNLFEIFLEILRIKGDGYDPQLIPYDARVTLAMAKSAVWPGVPLDKKSIFAVFGGRAEFRERVIRARSELSGLNQEEANLLHRLIAAS